MMINASSLSSYTGIAEKAIYFNAFIVVHVYYFATDMVTYMLFTAPRGLRGVSGSCILPPYKYILALWSKVVAGLKAGG